MAKSGAATVRTGAVSGGPAQGRGGRRPSCTPS